MVTGRLTLSIDEKVVNAAKQRGINISKTAEKCLRQRTLESPEIPLELREYVKVNLELEQNVIDRAKRSGLNLSMEVEKCLRESLGWLSK